MSELVCGVKVDRSVIGYKFPESRLTAIGSLFYVRVKNNKRKKRRRFVVCRCDCGEVGVFDFQHVKAGNSKSCGCLCKERIKETNTTHGATVGVCDQEYKIWKGMTQRCNNPNNRKYPIYGGRGIKVCGRWINSYGNFLEDMGKRPSKKHSIDRIDNDGDYCPENCRWATRSEQQRNTRRNHLLTVDGETKCMMEWAEIYGIDRSAIRQRLRKGWSDEDAVKTPV